MLNNLESQCLVLTPVIPSHYTVHYTHSACMHWFMMTNSILTLIYTCINNLIGIATIYLSYFVSCANHHWRGGDDHMYTLSLTFIIPWGSYDNAGPWAKNTFIKEFYRMTKLSAEYHKRGKIWELLLQERKRMMETLFMG